MKRSSHNPMRKRGTLTRRSLANMLDYLVPSIASFAIGPIAFADQPATYFRVERMDGEWKLLDPDFKPFYLRGVNHYGDGSGMPWNLTEKHGSAAAWRTSVRNRAQAWGFNYLPPSIGPTAIDPKTVPGPHGRHNLIKRIPEWSPDQYADLDFPFTIFLEFPRQYLPYKLVSTSIWRSRFR